MERRSTVARGGTLRVVLTLIILLLTGAASAQTNGVMMQYFHWYNSPSDNLWLKVADQADELAAAGITALWLPPAYKGVNGDDVGYGVYDLYDLGEFNQKGSVRTKYGTKAQYLSAIQAAHANGIQIYGDVVLNHKGGADAVEWVTATRVQTFDRNQEYGGDISIQAWTDFQFPGGATPTRRSSGTGTTSTAWTGPRTSRNPRRSTSSAARARPGTGRSTPSSAITITFCTPISTCSTRTSSTS